MEQVTCHGHRFIPPRVVWFSAECSILPISLRDDVSSDGTSVSSTGAAPTSCEMLIWVDRNGKAEALSEGERWTERRVSRRMAGQCGRDARPQRQRRHKVDVERGTNSVPSFAVAPDGRFLAYEAGPANGPFHLWSTPLDSLVPVPFGPPA